MKVRIETAQDTPGVIHGSDMKAGEYGIILSANDEDLVGHYVYRHGNDSRILDLSAPADSWSCPDLLRVQLLALGESITITRTE